MYYQKKIRENQHCEAGVHLRLLLVPHLLKLALLEHFRVPMVRNLVHHDRVMVHPETAVVRCLVAIQRQSSGQSQIERTAWTAGGRLPRMSTGVWVPN